MHPIGAFKHESMDKTEKKKKTTFIFTYTHTYFLLSFMLTLISFP